MVKPREHRVHMMLSAEEVEAIDDWRFNNRIATRSDAIRRLCQIGLSVDESRADLASSYQDLFKAAHEMLSVMVDMVAESDNHDEIKILAEPIVKTFQAVGVISPLIQSIVGTANNMKQQGDIEKIIAETEEVRSILRKTFNRSSTIKAETDEMVEKLTKPKS